MIISWNIKIMNVECKSHLWNNLGIYKTSVLDRSLYTSTFQIDNRMSFTPVRKYRQKRESNSKLLRNTLYNLNLQVASIKRFLFSQTQKQKKTFFRGHKNAITYLVRSENQEVAPRRGASVTKQFFITERCVDLRRYIRSNAISSQ